MQVPSPEKNDGGVKPSTAQGPSEAEGLPEELATCVSLAWSLKLL